MVSKGLFFLTAAFDKGDDRRLAKKPVFTSSQVNFISKHEKYSDA